MIAAPSINWSTVMDDGFLINGREGLNVFVNRYDRDTVWLSLYVKHGNVATEWGYAFTEEQAKELIAALQQVMA